jgi:D-alanyl-D-alanine carboxypeptidase
MSAGRLALDDRITVSRRAAGQPPSRLGLSVGMTIGVEHAVLALVTRSANDIATAVAEHLAASEFSFAMAMTERARALGMSRTTFRNASGLPDRGQWTTARDMSLLARALLRDFPNHYRYFAVSEFHYEGRTYRNHNTLLADDKGVDGIKTGYIRASGFNLVASALRDDRRVIGVVFGGRSAKSRDQHMRALIDTGYVALAALERSLKTTQSVASDVSSRRHWSVQVGAFSRFQTAENRAQEARSSLPELLGLAAISVAPLTSNGRTLYRARLSPLSRNAAVDVCVALQQRRFDCLPMSVSAES